MIEPFEGEEEELPSSCVVVEVRDMDQIYTYEFHLIIQDDEYITVGELRALRAGMEEALLRMNIILDKLGIKDEDETDT